MNGKNSTLLIFIFFLFTASALSADTISGAAAENIKTRDLYYDNIRAVFGFARTEITTAEKSGYSPDFSLVLLSISQKSGVGIGKLVTLRKNKGYSWKDMCDEYNVDYYALMDSIEKKLIDNKIIPPPATAAERKQNAATSPRMKNGGKK